MTSVVMPLPQSDRAKVVQVAKALVGHEQQIAAAWSTACEAQLAGTDETGSCDKFQSNVRLWLTSLADADFDAYFFRVEAAGIAFANKGGDYESMIMSFHLFEDATLPFLHRYFESDILGIVSVLDHLYHNVIAIVARAYFRRLEEERETFVRMATHDLKAPLTAMLLGSRLLTSERITRKSKLEIAQNIEKSIDGISRLVESMLWTGSLKDGGRNLHIEHVDVVATAREAAELLSESANEKGLLLTINGAPIQESKASDTMLVEGDRQLIWRAIINYLSNAIAYAESRVDLEIREDGESVTVSVRDDGPGISKEHLDRVFQDYFVVPGKKVGTGLGLSSVRRILELHRGTFGVESAPGQQTTFFFRLRKTLDARATAA